MTYDAREQSVYGGAPVELYLFACGPQTWRLTSADVPQTVSSQTYTPAAISRGEIDASDEDQAGQLQVTIPRTHAIAQLFVPDLPPQPLTLAISRFHRGDSEVVVPWVGEVVSVTFAGGHATLACMPLTHALSRQVPPNTYQSQCNWSLFSAPCGLDKASYRVSATLAAVSGAVLTSSAFGAHPDGYFRAGWVESLAGEKHWIIAHTGNTVTLLTPFRSLAVGQTLDAYPGCDRTLAACAAFGNLVHHCGFAFVPTRSPFVQGIG